MDRLTPLEAIRLRPGMYIGDVHDGSGMLHLVFEVLANALDEHLAGHTTAISVKFEGDVVEVQDNGRGLRVLDDAGNVLLDDFLTTFHQTPTADGHAPHVHISETVGGVGLFAVSAVCENFEIIARRKENTFRRKAARGKLIGSLKRTAAAATTGTTVRFRPDPDVFGATKIDAARLQAKLTELAYLAPGLDVRYNGEPIDGGDGLGSWHRRLTRQPLAEPTRHPLRIQARVDDIDVDCALGWAGNSEPLIDSFVSLGRTTEGGSHVEGLWHGLRAGLENVLSPQIVGDATSTRFRSSVGKGLVVLLHAGLFAPQLEGPTRGRLSNPVAKNAVSTLIAAAIPAYVAQHPTLRQRLRRACGNG